MIFKLLSTVTFLLLLLAPTSALSVVYIRGCKDQKTIDNIRQGLNFAVNNLQTIRSEEYSYINHIWDGDTEIDGQTPFYIQDSDRYQLGLTNDEIARIRTNIMDKDLSIRCAREDESLCHNYGAYASTAQNFFHLWLINGGMERAIVLCEHEYVSKCAMAKTLAHEVAHIADIEMSPRHARVRSYVEGNEIHRFDKVFKLGKAMGNACEHDRFDFEKTRHNGIDYYISEY